METILSPSPIDAVASDYITPKQAADLKGVTVGAIYKAIERGHIDGVRLLDRVAVKASDIAAWTPAGYTRGDVQRASVTVKPRGRNGGRPMGTKNPPKEGAVSE